MIVINYYHLYYQLSLSINSWVYDYHPPASQPSPLLLLDGFLMSLCRYGVFGMSWSSATGSMTLKTLQRQMCFLVKYCWTWLKKENNHLYNIRELVDWILSICIRILYV